MTPPSANGPDRLPAPAARQGPSTCPPPAPRSSALPESGRVHPPDDLPKMAVQDVEAAALHKAVLDRLSRRGRAAVAPPASAASTRRSISARLSGGRQI